MRSVVDAHFSALEKYDVLDGMDSFYQRAYSLVSSEKARAALTSRRRLTRCATITGELRRAADAAGAAASWRPAWRFVSMNLRRLGSPRQHQERHRAAGSGF